MLILGLESPEGETHYVAARVPERLRQDEPRDARPAARRRRAGRSGRSATTSPGCAPAPTAASGRSIPRPASSASRRARRRRRTRTRWRRCSANSIFTNVARHRRTAARGGRASTATVPERLTDWQGKPWHEGLERRRRRIRTRASPRRRASARRSRRKWEDPQGVPISAFIFGGRRARTAPLVFAGVRLEPRRLRRRVGRVGDDRGADRRGRRRAPRSDGDAAVLRLQHGRLLRPLAARWARGSRTRRRSSTSTGSARTPTGKFLWPGFGENMRVLRWILERCEGSGRARRDRRSATLPDARRDRHRPASTLDAGDDGASCSRSRRTTGAPRPQGIGEFFDKFGDRLPAEMERQRQALVKRLG